MTPSPFPLGIIMLRSLLSRSLLALFGVVLLVSTGCGPSKGSPVTGKVVLPAAFKLADEDQVEVSFLPDDPKVKRGATAMAKPPGLTFTANTSETTGVLPGKYKIAVKVTPYMGSPGSQERKQKFDDAINKHYESYNTKLTYEVTAGAQSITIDLTKGTVTKD
jgi:hypothetical protein